MGMLLLVPGCTGESPAQDPTVLRVGVLPDESEHALRERYGDLLAYLSEQVGVLHELYVPANYADLLASFARGEFDLAYFGGVTFIRASQESGALPLVMRDVDLRFTSYFLVRRDAPGGTIEDFRGQHFAFGSNLSTSGHLMPRYFLRQLGITPERFFATTEYAGSHDRTVYAVRDGRVDLGAVNAEVVDQMLGDGRIRSDEVRVLWTTPPYADYVWATRPGLSEELLRRLRDAFLSLDPGNKGHLRVLSRLGAGGFLPASVEDFAALRKTMLGVAAFQPGGSTRNSQ